MTVNTGLGIEVQDTGSKQSSRGEEDHKGEGPEEGTEVVLLSGFLGRSLTAGP